MKLKLATLFSFIYFFSFSQNKIIDSLSTLIKTPISDSLKIKAYGDLCWYYGDISIDSAFYYGNLALNLSKNTKNLKGEAQAYNDIGILHYKLSNYNKSISFYKNALSIRQKLHDTLGIGSIYNKMGIAYQRIFKMDSAIFYNTKALEIYENANHTRYVALIKNNNANIYFNLKQYKKALKEHLEVAKIRTDIKDYFGLTYSYTNIGNSYLYLNDTTKSIIYYKKGIEIAEQYNYNSELSTLYNNYGTTLKNQGSYVNAMKYFNKSLKLRENLNDKYGVSSVLLNMGDLYLTTGKINKSEAILRKGLKLATLSNANKLKLNAYRSLLSFFAYKKNTDSVLHYQNLFSKAQDSILTSTVTKQIAEIQEKYATSQKEKEIAQQKEMLLKNELEIKNKNLYTVLLGSGFLIFGIISFSLYKRQQHKKREYNNKLKLKEAQTYSKLQDQRLRISRDLHDNIGSQLTFIISSIDNLKYLTQKSNDNLRNRLSEINNFANGTISQLRDTIWAMNKNEITFEDFQTRILSFIEKAKSATSNVQFNFKSKISEAFSFSTIKGINVFRIIQEAVNNIIKYAKASKVNIHISEKKEFIEFTITDNGIGFDKNSVALGNGLENMQKRAKEIGGKITIVSKINEGTKITLKCTKNKTNAV